MIPVVPGGKSVAALAAAVALAVVAALVAGVSFASGTTPKGWFLTGSAPKEYCANTDAVTRHGGKASAALEFVGGNAKGFGTLMQMFSAENYRGKRLRLTGWIKTEDVNAAQMWLSIHGVNKIVGFDNMDDRALSLTQDWKKCEIVLDVPDDAVNISFGFFVVGTGKVWADDFQFDVVDKTVVVTGIYSDFDENNSRPAIASSLKQPINLTFDD